MDFAELFKLANLLTDHHIPYTIKDLWDGWQILDNLGRWNVIIRRRSYGHDYGLLEMMADGIADITDNGDNVIGWLTANKAFEILQDLGFIPRGIC